LRDRLWKANEIIRSAFQVADRKGEKTNWESFKESLRVELEREHKIMYPKPPNP
jgi:hypothetical protein